MMTKGKQALVLEDDPEVLDVMSSMLEDIGMIVLRAPTIARAREHASTGRVDIALVDARVAEGRTDLFCDGLRAANVPLIVTSGHPLLIPELAASGWPFLAKPFRVVQLHDMVRTLLLTPPGT